MPHITIPERLNAASVFVDRHLEEGRGGKPAILCGDVTVTYRELAEKVNRFGNALHDLNVRMEERVAIMMPDSPECVFSFFGAIKSGAVAIPFNTNLKPEDYEYMLNDSRAQVLVIDASLVERLTPVKENLRYLKHVIIARGSAGNGLSFDTILNDASSSLEAADTHKDDSAFWLYSSGTTGFPKGTIHLQHDMMIAAEYYAKDTIGLREDDVSFSVAKLFHAYGLGNGLYFPLWVGGTTVLLPDRPLPSVIFGQIDRFTPTVFYSVPTSFAATLHFAEKEGHTSLQKVRMCVSAGEPLPAPLYDQWKERFGVDILDGIGSTEILHIFISNRPGRIKPGSTGEVVFGYEGKILDDDGDEVGLDEIGTLYMKGDSIASGYWNKHEKTKITFCGAWINTHDKYRKDADEFYWYEGRADDMFKVSGLYVSPAEVESTLMSHPTVLESGVVGVKNSDGLVKPRAYVVLKDARDASDALVDELKKHVKSSILPHKYPRSIVFVNDLPKTATGKIQRYKLREIADGAAVV